MRLAPPWVSVRAKLAVPVVVTLLASGIAGAVLVRRGVERSLEDEQHHRALALVSELALRSTRPALVEDLGGLQRVVTELATRGDVIYVVVIGAAGQVLASSFPSGVPDDLVRIFETPREGLGASVRFRTDDGVVADYVAQMIEGRLGTVHLGVSLSRVRAQARLQGQLVLLVTGLAALGLVAVALLVAHLATRPVRQLAYAASRVRDGDLTVRSEVTARDELGELAGRFDAMVARLADNQAALERAHVLMVRAERMAVTGQVASGVAHEIGNPLHAARQFIEALREHPDHGDRYVPLIDEALARMHRVIGQMLEFSRERELQPRAADVNEVVERSLDFLRYDHRLRDVRVERALADGLPAARIDPDALGQVLINLLVNALDAVGADGNIRIATGVANDADRTYLEIQVGDDGPGVPSELRDQIFDPFFTTKEAGEGTGLGLSVSVGLMEAQGGALELRAEAGGGATFVVRVPLA